MARAAHSVQVATFGERAALNAGELRAGDLHQAAAWQVRVAAEKAQCEREHAEASKSVRQTSKLQLAAVAELAGRKADAEVVEKSRRAWATREGKRAEQMEEENAAELWRAPP